MKTLDVATFTCREFVELATELLGDGLSSADRIVLEQHLLVCPPCTVHLGQMRSTIELTAAALQVRVPAPMPAALLEAFRRRKLPR